MPSALPPNHMFDFYATKEDRYPVANAPVPFRMMVGAGVRAIHEDGTNVTRGMVGNYGHLVFRPNYYGPGGTNRDARVEVKRYTGVVPT